jgi:hypothetical protein
MDVERHLLETEQQFWEGDAAFYRDNLADESLMVFPLPVGAMGRDETIRSIGTSQRWVDVVLEDHRVVWLCDDVALLTYSATATRQGEGSSHTTLASSIYVRRDGAWKLAFHQQTP